MLLVIGLGTVIDYFVHSSSERFAVPSWYYRNKVIFGTVWGAVAVLVSLKFIQNYRWRALFVALVVAVVLQIKYFLEGYDLFFVFLFMGLHFLMFLWPAWFLFKKFNYLF